MLDGADEVRDYFLRREVLILLLQLGQINKETLALFHNPVRVCIPPGPDWN